MNSNQRIRLTTCTATSGINIVTDVWILALPIKTLKLINRPKKEKAALTFIFGAGIFAAIMSVVRLQSIHKYTQSTDPFRDAIAVCSSSNKGPRARLLSACDAQSRLTPSYR